MMKNYCRLLNNPAEIIYIDIYISIVWRQVHFLVLGIIIASMYQKEEICFNIK